MKRKISVFVVLVLLMSLFASSAFAYPHSGKGWVEKHNKGTSTVIVGDSRAFFLWDSGYTSKSLIGSRGSLYSTGDTSGDTIHSAGYGSYQKGTKASSKDPSRYSVIKQSIKDGLKNHKKCKVILIASINECYTGISFDADKSAKAVARLAKALKNVTYTSGKKTYSPRVYIVEAPKSIHSSYPNKRVDKYNSKIKELDKKASYFSYVSLRDPKKSEFCSDKLHFKGKKGYNKYMWEKFADLSY